MNRRVVDPAQLSGEALADWYRRTPDEIEQERILREQDEYDAFFSGLRPRKSKAPAGSWREADASRPVARAPYRPPNPQRDRARAASPVEGVPQPPGATGSFFGTHSTQYVNPTVPAPLNVVEPARNARGMYRLSDGTLVDADEVERIYAEQRRRARGEDEFEPAARVQAHDKIKDGIIPKAGELTRGARELDVTCHPYGGWELDPHFKRYSQRTQQYESQISRAPGLDYVVRIPGEKAVKFDGCAVWDPRHQLLEAKGPGYASLIDVAKRYGFFKSVRNGPVSQSDRQYKAARGRPIDWHHAEDGAAGFFKKTVGPRPPIRLYHTPVQ